MKIFRRSQKPEVGQVAEEFPGAGISIEEVNSLVVAVFAQKPSLDRRILSIIVVAPSRVRVTTGLVTGGLAADTNIVEVMKDSDGWRVQSAISLQS